MKPGNVKLNSKKALIFGQEIDNRGEVHAECDQDLHISNPCG